MFNYLFAVFALLAIASTGANLFAQQKLISGTVTNEKGEPVEGATVTVKGTNIATSTNSTGVYRLDLPAKWK